MKPSQKLISKKIITSVALSHFFISLAILLLCFNSGLGSISESPATTTIVPVLNPVFQLVHLIIGETAQEAWLIWIAASSVLYGYVFSAVIMTFKNRQN